MLDVSVRYGREIGNNTGFGTRNRFAPDGTVLRLADYDFPTLSNYADLSLSYRQPLWGGDLSLGGVIKQERESSRVAERISFPAPANNSGLESDRARNAEARLEYHAAGFM